MTSPSTADFLRPLVLRAHAGLIRAGYLPRCPKGDRSCHWSNRAAEVNRRAWKIVQACGGDGEVLDLVVSFIEAGDLPYWMPQWDKWLAGTAKDARHLVELSKCEDCGARVVKKALGVALEPDPLLPRRAELIAEGKLEPKLEIDADGHAQAGAETGGVSGPETGTGVPHDEVKTEA